MQLWINSTIIFLCYVTGLLSTARKKPQSKWIVQSIKVFETAARCSVLLDNPVPSPCLCFPCQTSSLCSSLTLENLLLATGKSLSHTVSHVIPLAFKHLRTHLHIDLQNQNSSAFCIRSFMAWLLVTCHYIPHPLYTPYSSQTSDRDLRMLQTLSHHSVSVLLIFLLSMPSFPCSAWWAPLYPLYSVQG